MSKKNFKKNIKKSAQVDNNEALVKSVAMTMVGETMGNTIIELLQSKGEEFEGLTIGTYALAKAWSALKMVAKVKHVPVNSLFEMLVPSFEEDFERLLADEMK